MVTLILPKTNSSPLKMDGWNKSFLLGSGLFEKVAFAVSFREGKVSKRFLSQLNTLPSLKQYFLSQPNCMTVSN